jgi:hypothetical protein
VQRRPDIEDSLAVTPMNDVGGDDEGFCDPREGQTGTLWVVEATKKWKWLAEKIEIYLHQRAKNHPEYGFAMHSYRFDFPFRKPFTHRTEEQVVNNCAAFGIPVVEGTPLAQLQRELELFNWRTHLRQVGWRERAFTVFEDKEMVELEGELAANKTKLGPNLEVGDIIQYECCFSRGLMHAITVIGKREIPR